VSGGGVNEEKDGEAGRADKDGEGAGLVWWSRSRASSPSVPSGRTYCIITVIIKAKILVIFSSTSP
jgi:hypothetical protein